MELHQTSLFEGLLPTYKIDKPIRLIELFAGIGAQAKALENLGVNFEHWKAVEIDKYAMKSYNAIHGTNFETSDITKIHADDLEIREREIRLRSYLLISMPRLIPSRKTEGDGKRKRNTVRASVGSGKTSR